VELDRRQFLMAGAAGLLVLAGCAKQPPGTVRSASAVTPSGIPAPTPTPSGPGYDVAAGTTPAESTVAALVAGALVAQGFASAPSSLPSGTAYDLVAAVGAGVPPFALGFANTLEAQFATSDNAPAPDQLTQALASVIAPGASLLSASPCDGSLVWAVAAGSSVSSLDGLSALKGKTVIVPTFAVNRSDGIPGLKAIYGASLSAKVEDDPAARRAALMDGTAALGAFRACDVGELSGLTALADPKGMIDADPMVVLFKATLATDQPTVVLAVNTLLNALTKDAFDALEPQVSGGADAATVASGWIASNLVAG